MQVTRRGLVTGAAVGGGLLVAWWFLPRNYANPLEPASGEHLFGAWIKIAEDGVVSVAVPQLEMGQGVTTLIPQIVAQELGADWRQVAVEPAPVASAYPNVPLAERWAELWDPVSVGVSETTDDMLAQRFARAQRFTATADGTSLAAYEAPAREAAAAARAMLALEAADRWGVAWEECQVVSGIVSHGDKSATFGELAGGAADQSPPDPPPLRPEAPSDNPPPGSLPDDVSAIPQFPRIDLPSKVDGSYRFAADVRLPGMVYAAIRHGPNNGSELTGFNEAAAEGISGIVGAVRHKRWLAVAATTWWSAQRALEAMAPQFTVSYPVDSADIEARIETLLRSGDSYLVAETGFGEEGMTRVDTARRYDVEPAHAAPVETASAAARWSGGRLELWIASQAPEQARKAAAKAVGISPEDVALYPMPAGGSFDARLEHEHAIEIAHIAKELGRPVQLTWPRRDELIRSRPRAPAGVLIGAQLAEGGQGSIDAMRVRVACQPSSHEFGRRLFGNLIPSAAIRDTTGQKDELALEGAVPPYDLPSVSVHHVPVETGYPAGRVRGNAHQVSAFAIESFIDEVAAENNREPLSYRMSMLGGDIRLAACLQRAASMAEWDGGVNQSGQGLACHRIGDAETGARIACVATARRGEGGVRVARLSAAVDIGRIVNIDIARQQIEGGLMFGIGIALGNALRMRGGLPASFDYADLGLPRLADCPEIDVDFLPSEAAPADPGELGTVVAPPAIANALFSATGLRLRRLPLLSSGL
ncbi:probable transmembrane isoquinoline 1-oxidoreductase (beta subunit) oxidoreductase protein [Erythrobacter sp. NAP1]|uniref:xanthine dehydrogenase family protein molybdopterin-binding subunit n=1 Tax=Erythrobacter sp. NAP1 TaxID=237727 RepID=UPI0000687671|nr:molybdopterin cofactor-binding domain-containing protein [Erythrobacter sp. NAP1]EAQ28936.1 probable transmembrane isoquinoline 1-oxidoreductase (beta subunit) oxidoreductase protein [Erythrobacter sp. NAP1]